MTKSHEFIEADEDHEDGKREVAAVKSGIFVTLLTHMVPKKLKMC
ncbi:MAG: hypothetical protein ABSA86_03840 [Oryzomonas sp.]